MKNELRRYVQIRKWNNKYLEKVYTPVVGGKPLHFSWKTRTHAELYGERVFFRYIRLMQARDKLKREEASNKK